MSYVFRSSGYIRDRSALHCRCIASCRLRVDTRWTLRVNVNVVSLCLSSWLHVVYRSRFCETINSEFRRDVLLHERWTFVRKFYQFGNTVQRVSREGWHERRWFYMEREPSRKIKLLEWEDIDFWKYVFRERGVKNIFAFFFENVTCRVERVKVFIFKIIEFVIEFLFFFEEY